ncbi:TonB-dependent receptor [Halioglobus maricola]|nr:TonB-dependent receptor [Halioglobus maricola]
MTLLKRKPIAGALAVAGFSALSSGVSAQMVLEEVVVVANRVESNLMETATAVTAFDAGMRDQLGIENGQDISARTPSLTVAPSRVGIRGVGRTTVGVGSDPGVGMYWDGVYSTETIFGYSNFLDIERLEVLRGPQGTLYGRNSIGGAINFISMQPTDEWEGKVVGEVGSHESYLAQGMVSGPITDKLSMLAALSKIERKEGFQENISNGDEYDLADREYASIAFKHLTTDRWTNSLKVFTRDASTTPESPYVLDAYSTDYIQEVFDVDTGEQLNFPGIFPGQNFVNPNQGMEENNPALRDEKYVSVDRKPFVENERDGVTFISDYDADNFSLKYTFGWSDFNYKSDRDADGIRAEDSRLDWNQLNLTVAPGLALPVSLLTGYGVTPNDTTRPFSLSSETISHELQLTSDFDGDINFIGGLYYYNSEEDQTLAFIEHNRELMETYALFGSFIGAPVDVEGGDLFRGVGSVDTTSYAVYGQMNWDLTASTILTFGLRYSYDEKDGDDSWFAQWVGDPENPTTYRSIEDDWDKFTWRVGVDHFLSDDHFLYAFAATGYRSGGFNLLSPSGGDQVGSVDPENLLSFEVGYKGSFWDQRLNLTTAAYYYDYTDLQVQKDEVVDGVAIAIYENADEANAWGLEAELAALLAEGLTFSMAMSYNDTEYEDFSSLDSTGCAIGPLAQGNSLAPLCTEEQDLSGNNFTLSPELGFSANLIYEWDMMSLAWRAAASYMYTDEQYTSPFNNSYDTLDSWDRWDARLSAGSTDLTWEVTAYVKNITDDRQVILKSEISTTQQVAEYDLTEPRTYGIRLTYNF